MWILFPLLGILMGALYYWHTIPQIYLTNTVINFAFVTLTIGILYIYCKLIAKEIFINQSFGMGDLFYFYAFALGFPTITFIVLFAFSLVFSLLIFLFLKKRLHLKTVPLAGLMALFLCSIFVWSFFLDSNQFYAH